MKPYHKIQSLFKRNPETGIFIPEFSCEEFKILWDCDWNGREKVDGTNLRIGVMDDYSHGDVPKVEFRGRKNNSIIPPFLFRRLEEIFPLRKLESVFNAPEESWTDFCLYCEGVGHKIQKVGKYYNPRDHEAILFDVKVGKYWLHYKDIVDIANKLGIKYAPKTYRGDLVTAIRLVAGGIRSFLTVDSTIPAEGLVLTPVTGMLRRNGDRIITKVKTRDFAKIADLDEFLFQVNRKL